MSTRVQKVAATPLGEYTARRRYCTKRWKRAFLSWPMRHSPGPETLPCGVSMCCLSFGIIERLDLESCRSICTSDPCPCGFVPGELASPLSRHHWLVLPYNQPCQSVAALVETPDNPSAKPFRGCCPSRVVPSRSLQPPCSSFTRSRSGSASGSRSRRTCGWRGASRCVPAALCSLRPRRPRLPHRPGTPPLQGFDEYMNLVLEDAEEVSVKRKTRKPLGTALLKGENVALICAAKAS